MTRAASQRLRAPLQTDAERSIGFEVEPANGRQDFLVAVKRPAKAVSVLTAFYLVFCGTGAN